MNEWAAVKGCLQGTIATAIFIATNGLCGIQCKFSHGTIATMTLNHMQSISCNK